MAFIPTPHPRLVGAQQPASFLKLRVIFVVGTLGQLRRLCPALLKLLLSAALPQVQLMLV